MYVFTESIILAWIRTYTMSDDSLTLVTQVIHSTRALKTICYLYTGVAMETGTVDTSIFAKCEFEKETCKI